MKYVYRQEIQFWLGYFEDFADYIMQGEPLENIMTHFKDLYQSLILGLNHQFEELVILTLGEVDR